MFANSLVTLFKQGGPIMWPILVVAIVSLAIVGERLVWWIRESIRRDSSRLEKVLAALENGDFAEAAKHCKGSEDPVIRMIWHGLNHVNSSLQGALQVAAGAEIKRASRFLVVMDTCITVAPLLGLLGTVTGIMGSFAKVGSDFAIQGVMDGIGEALIATAAGLGIAIFNLLPYNYLTERVGKLQFELETAATNVEVLVNKAKAEGFDTVEFRREASSTNR